LILTNCEQLKENLNNSQCVHITKNLNSVSVLLARMWDCG